MPYSFLSDTLFIYDYINEQDFSDMFNLFDSNPDFTRFGVYDSIETIFEVLEFQGLSRQEIINRNLAQYGYVIEILENIDGELFLFIGTREFIKTE